MTMSIGGTSGLVFPDSSTQNTAATGFGFKNRIINGAMMIDKRNDGASVNNIAGSSYSLDRWRLYGDVANKFSVQQNAGSVTPPAGYANYLGATSLSAYSVPTAETYILTQPIEGLNVADLGWGAANASTVTLSFWVRSSLTGTFGGAISNSGYARNYPFSYTINSANTWEQKTIAVAGDTTGTWLKTNGIGIVVGFSLGVGSGSVATAGAWTSSFAVAATGSTNVVGTNAATFYITGVQLEKGSTATSFDYRPYGTELALCQRYYTTINDFYFRVYQAASSAAGQTLTLPVKMRSSPTLTKVGTWAVSGIVGQPSVASASGDSTQSFTIYAPWSGSGDGYFTTTATSQYVTAASEL